MNYIKFIQEENNDMREKIKELNEQVTALLIYYTSKKFEGFENNYTHVSTDLLPKLFELRQKIHS